MIQIPLSHWEAHGDREHRFSAKIKCRSCGGITFVPWQRISAQGEIDGWTCGQCNAHMDACRLMGYPPELDATGFV